MRTFANPQFKAHLGGRIPMIMTTLYVALESGVLVARGAGGAWDAALEIEGAGPQCLALDPLRPAIVYCGTDGNGLLRSTDAGHTWHPAGEGITHRNVTSVAVSVNERAGDLGVVYAGTEPTALFRSEDGGDTWEELSGL